MRDSLAFDILSTMMNDDWRADSPVPSTSQGDIESLLRLDEDVSVAPIVQFDGGVPEVTTDGNLILEQSYEETLQSLYSEDSQSDPLWTPASMSTSPPVGGDNSLDFLSDECFMDSSMTEVVKEELKSRIKAKRLASGQEELSVEFKDRQESTEELTEEDIELREQRREKNRLAAQKCRNKKRERADTLENDIDRLETKQERLKKEIERLQDEREHLEGVIEVHGIVCPKIRKLDKA